MDVDALDVDALVKIVYPPSTGQAILMLLARRVGEVVTLEELAIAAYGDTPAIWAYAHTDDWHWNAGGCIRKLRKRLYAAGVDVDIEAVRRRGYKLVTRKARRRPTRADLHKWQTEVLKRYDALVVEQPGLSIRQARDILALNLPTVSGLARRLPLGTLKNWLRQRKQQGGSP